MAEIENMKETGGELNEKTVAKPQASVDANHEPEKNLSDLDGSKE